MPTHRITIGRSRDRPGGPARRKSDSGSRRHEPFEPGTRGLGALLTQVPIGSPAMARSMLPSFLKLNTRIGSLFSRHMPMAVMSMTLSCVAQHLLVGQVLVEDGVRVLLGVGRVDAVDAGGLEQDLDAELLAPQGRGRVGGDERAAGARWPG